MKEFHITALIGIVLCISSAFFVIPIGPEENITPHEDSGSKELTKTILDMDSILFTAVNSADLPKLKTLFTNDLEFYHDAGGLAGYEKTMENFQNLFNNNKDLRRVLVEGSTEVYPIKDYGAIQTGSHKFCRLRNGVLVECATFKFMHVWKKTDEGWKISRAISYDH